MDSGLVKCVQGEEEIPSSSDAEMSAQLTEKLRIEQREDTLRAQELQEKLRQEAREDRIRKETWDREDRIRQEIFVNQCQRDALLENQKVAEHQRNMTLEQFRAQSAEEKLRQLKIFFRNDVSGQGSTVHMHF